MPRKAKSESAAPSPAPAEPTVEEKFEVELRERTRKSLIERLHDWEDRKSWDEFYRTYWRLIYGVGIKSGLRPEEAMDVVQETTIAIAKQSKEHRYDPKAGSFKVWLMNMTRWRIGDQFRKRAKDTAMHKSDGDDDRKTAILDRFADPKADSLDRIWDLEWRQSLASRALAAVKLKVSPRQYQIYDAYVVKNWSVKETMDNLGVSMAQVYLAKHRVGALIKKEITELEKQLI